ncbi:MAG: DegT/DnrJ/EryC1/StrS family aminotransferase [Gemmatimonadales bacterium]
MTWRRQLPAYSPLPLRAVIAGAADLVGGSSSARADVTATLADAFGASDVLLTDSGTGALTLAIRGCLAQRPGTAVALPAYSCYDLATAADGAGAPVVLYDLVPETLAPELESLRRALERGVGAVVLVHLFGVPADPKPVRAAAERIGAWLIEDAAQGAGASLRGRPLGSFGDLVVLSFGRGKGVTAGRGGALLAHGDAAASVMDRARSELLPSVRGVRELIQLKAQWLLGSPSLYVVPSALPFLQLGETRYHAPPPTRAMSAVALSALGVTLSLGEREASVRRANAARLLVRREPGLSPVLALAGAEPGYLRLPFLATPAVRSAAESPAARALGVMPGYPRALCDLEGFAARVGNLGDTFVGARMLAARLITLPTHSLLREGDLARLETWLAATA